MTDDENLIADRVRVHDVAALAEYLSDQPHDH